MLQKLIDVFTTLFVEWEYGHYRCGDGTLKRARKHKMYGNVQFLLWKKGQHHHKRDYWVDLDQTWWFSFKKEAKWN